MVDFLREPITAADIKAKALELGADLVGIADGEAMNEHVPDIEGTCRPIDITAVEDCRSAAGRSCALTAWLAPTTRSSSSSSASRCPMGRSPRSSST